MIRLDSSPLVVDLWLTYGSPRRTGRVWRSEPVDLDEPIQTHIIQSFFIREFTILLSQVKDRSDFWYGLEVNQFLAYNQPIRSFTK